jgi:hypothetical protein
MKKRNGNTLIRTNNALEWVNQLVGSGAGSQE